MAITNTTPVTPGAANIYWIFFAEFQPAVPAVAAVPATDTTPAVAAVPAVAAFLRANMAPSDGKYLIGNQSLTKYIHDGSDAAVALVNALLAAVQTASGKTSAVTKVDVFAGDPLKPVILVAHLADKTVYRINDLFAALAANSAMAAVYQSIVAFLATKVAA